jgi:hypothetical protein
MVEGRIETALIEDAATARIVLVPTWIGRNEQDLPRRLRLSLRGEKAVAQARPGAPCSVRRQSPLSLAAMISRTGLSSRGLAEWDSASERRSRSVK